MAGIITGSNPNYSLEVNSYGLVILKPKLVRPPMLVFAFIQGRKRRSEHQLAGCQATNLIDPQIY